MRTAYCPKCKDDKRFYTDYGKGHSWIRICTDCDNDISFNYKFAFFITCTYFCKSKFKNKI